MSNAAYLQLAGISSSVFALQEVHQSLDELRFFLRRIAPEVIVFGPFDTDACGQARGGVATVVPLSANSLAASSSRSLVSGRVLKTWLVGAHAEIRHYNVHNHDLHQGDVQRISALISTGLEWAQADPQSRLVVVCGDFNFAASEPLHLSQPSLKRSTRPTNNNRTHMKSWLVALGKMIEISAEDPTHYCKESHTVAQLDRLWLSEPGWVACQLRHSAAVVSSPERLSEQRISDHAALRVHLQHRSLDDSYRRPVPRFVYLCDDFRARLDKLLRQGGRFFTDMSPPRQMERYKVLIDAAAYDTLQQILVTDIDKPEAQLIFARQAARAIWRQDARLAQKVANSSEVFDSCVNITPEGLVGWIPFNIERLSNNSQFSKKVLYMGKPHGRFLKIFGLGWSSNIVVSFVHALMISVECYSHWWTCGSWHGSWRWLKKNANLKLKPPECVIAPLAGAFGGELRDGLRMGLEQLVPRWLAFRIEAKLLYLGMWSARLAELGSLVQSWARNWLCSFFFVANGLTDFEDWMKWTTDFLSIVFRYKRFVGLFSEWKAAAAFARVASALGHSLVLREVTLFLSSALDTLRLWLFGKASTSGSDFQQWVEWCVPYTANTLRYGGFEDILQYPANTMSDGAKRWELAIDLCLHGWHQGAIPRERFRQQLSDPWPPNERRRLAALRRQGLAHLRQLDWCPDVTRMPPEERENFQLVRRAFFPGPAKGAAPDLLLLPHLHEQALLDAASAAASAHLPDEDNESIDADGYPNPTDEDIESMVEAANATAAPAPGGSPPHEYENETMDAGEFSPHFGPILTDEEFEAQALDWMAMLRTFPLLLYSVPSSPPTLRGWSLRLVRRLRPCLVVYFLRVKGNMDRCLCLLQSALYLFLLVIYHLLKIILTARQKCEAEALAAWQKFYGAQQQDGACPLPASGFDREQGHACHFKDAKLQTFKVLFEGKVLGSMRGTKCLECNTGNSNMYMYHCHGRANRQWYIDGEQMKTKWDDKCLDYSFDGRCFEQGSIL
ncbi:unnamed protein product [Prorocentrum cordatum]|uniref:Endonuclease/exonuclease/phosphatase domain-containing protein n=1 Tax=Prorocentrum cordatum TaxID=2364126 RepID=A0ABN9Y4G4_9DINO|nr:unnamed protein product [Polarella glacialis]